MLQSLSPSSSSHEVPGGKRSIPKPWHNLANYNHNNNDVRENEITLIYESKRKTEKEEEREREGKQVTMICGDEEIVVPERIARLSGLVCTHTIIYYILLYLRNILGPVYIGC